mgnify:CR=1 FL=1
MSAFGVRTDMFCYGSKGPLIAISGHRMRARERRETIPMAVGFLCELIQELSFFLKKFKPIGACSTYIPNGILFPGHFIPAFFYDGFSYLNGT